MRIIKTRKFAKWAVKSEVLDSVLINAANEIAGGQYEANYGGGVLKKRVPNKERGKSGGTRTIVAFKKDNHCFFMFGFEKTDKDNISPNEEKALKLIAKTLLAYTNEQIDERLNEGSLIEVNHE